MRNKLEAWLLASLAIALYISLVCMTWLAVYWSGFTLEAIFAGIGLSLAWTMGAMAIAAVVVGGSKRKYDPPAPRSDWEM